MLFVPYADETKGISTISKYSGEDYALIRLTDTMVDKNIIDCNEFMREVVEGVGVDYDAMEHGSANGVTLEATFITETAVIPVKLNFYRVNNSRGDRRFSIQTIKRKVQEHTLYVDDLLYFSVYKTADGVKKVFIVDLTHNMPSEYVLQQALGTDRIMELFDHITPILNAVVNGGWHNNSKGEGPISPKDVGDTLEHLLGIDTNNRTNADYAGLIEVKAKGPSRTLDTLFTLRPCFDGTPIAEYEPKDRNRVSAFARYYGYESDAHPGCNCLYITIGAKEAPQNEQGFYLDVDEERKRVNLMGFDPYTGKTGVTAFWTFEQLKQQLMAKHPSTLWVKADSRMAGNMGQFKYYNEFEFSRTPQFMTFISLIKAGIITYDWRGYVSWDGPYVGKNHGNAWRIKPRYKDKLFGSLVKITLNATE